jgi:hypothetical protein
MGTILDAKDDAELLTMVLGGFPFVRSWLHVDNIILWLGSTLPAPTAATAERLSPAHEYSR